MAVLHRPLTFLRQASTTIKAFAATGDDRPGRSDRRPPAGGLPDRAAGQSRPASRSGRQSRGPARSARARRDGLRSCADRCRTTCSRALAPRSPRPGAAERAARAVPAGAGMPSKTAASDLLMLRLLRRRISSSGRCGIQSTASFRPGKTPRQSPPPSRPR